MTVTGNSARRRGNGASRNGRRLQFRKRVSAALVQVAGEHGLKSRTAIAKCLDITERSLRNGISGRRPFPFEAVAMCEELRVDFFDEVARREKGAA